MTIGASRVPGIQSTKAHHAVAVLLMIRGDGHKYLALIIFKEAKGISPSTFNYHSCLPENVCTTANSSAYISNEIIGDYFIDCIDKKLKIMIIDC